MLIAATTFAPMARAACDINHFAAAADAVQVARYATVTGTDNANRCGDKYDTVTQHGERAGPEAAVAPSTPAPEASPAAFMYPSLPTTGISPVKRRLPLPPSESAFRRVPKLLI